MNNAATHLPATIAVVYYHQSLLGEVDDTVFVTRRMHVKKLALVP